MKGITEAIVYRTSDGQQFDDQESANRHELRLQNAGRVEKFLDANYPKAEEGAKQGPSRAIAKKAVEQFLEGGF